MCRVEELLKKARNKDLSEADKLEIECFLRSGCDLKSELTVAYNTRLIKDHNYMQKQKDPTSHEQDRKAQGK